MNTELFKKAFSFFFISIFFMKMVVAVVPVIYSFKTDGTVSDVILQLEIEDNADKSPEKLKEALFKEYISGTHFFVFESPLQYIGKNPLTAESCMHIRSFYPPVPTPPPNVA